jgi:6-phospho-beta-glucosidase
VSGQRILTVLGGGSVWTPCLIRQLSQLTLSEDLSIVLQGHTDLHLSEVMNFSRGFTGKPPDIRVTVDPEEAVKGASFILNQVRIGGWQARLDDETLPIRIGGIGDESLGLGGLLAAIRSRSFVFRTSRFILQHAPDAWLLNLTNPSDLVSRAWCEAGIQRVLSLCDYPQKWAREMAMLVKRPELALDFGFIGMTHVGWLIPPPGIRLSSLWQRRPRLRSWYRKWGALPSPWRMHLDDPDTLMASQGQQTGGRVYRIMRLVEDLREVIRKKEHGQYMRLLQERKPVWYAEVVIPAVKGLLEGGPVHVIAGSANRQRLPRLAGEVIVEGRAVIDRQGVHPEPLPDNTLCQQDIAGFGGLRDLAFAAMMRPNRDTLSCYVQSDPFSQAIVSGKKIDRVLHYLEENQHVSLDN